MNLPCEFGTGCMVRWEHAVAYTFFLCDLSIQTPRAMRYHWSITSLRETCRCGIFQLHFHRERSKTLKRVLQDPPGFELHFCPMHFFSPVKIIYLKMFVDCLSYQSLSSWILDSGLISILDSKKNARDNQITHHMIPFWLVNVNYKALRSKAGWRWQST